MDITFCHTSDINKSCGVKSAHMMWQNQSPSREAQQDDRHELQITLQEVINIINMLINVSQEETTLANVSQKETMLANVNQEKITLANVSQEETILANVSQEEMMLDDELPWFN